MEQLVLKPLGHRGNENIAMYFPGKGSLNKAVRTIKNVRWSGTHKCWYVSLSRKNHQAIEEAFKGLISIDASSLRNYLAEQNKTDVDRISEPLLKKKAVFVQPPAITKIKATKTPDPVHAGKSIHAVNEHVLPTLRQHLVLRSYSPSTIRTYINEVGAFLRTIGHHPVESFTTQRLKDYLQYCAEKLQLTENTLHSRMNALKYYFENVLGRERFFWDIPRPKKHIQLPNVLSKEEMVRLIRAIDNLKHRTMIMLGYACGLRVSEITGLEIRDVDEGRCLLFIRRAKGKKDRVVSLSPVMLVMIREYKTRYKPERFLFEGQPSGTSYSVRSLESIIHSAKIKAGIRKPGSMHMLRHSFATHLIDKGTDVVFIQKLLGHNNIKTTLRYLHVTNKDMLNILSPLEDIKDFL